MGCCNSKSHRGSKNRRKNYSINVHQNTQDQIVAVQKAKNANLNNEDLKLQQIYKTIKQNDNFKILLDQSAFDSVFGLQKTQNWGNMSKNALIQLLQNYIRYSVKCISSQMPNISVPFQYNISDYGLVFGKQIVELRDNFMNRNNKYIRTLNYIDEFKNYKFSFDQDNISELIKMQKRITQLSKDNPPSVFYLASYLKRCCKNLQNNSMPINQINKKLQKSVDKINQDFSPNSQFQIDTLYVFMFEQNQFERLKKQTHQYRKPKFYLTQKDKKKQLSGKIAEMANFAKNAQQTLFNLTYNECIRNKGFGYNLDLKVKNIQDEDSIKRVKEKLLKDQIKKYYKNVEFKSKKIKQLRKQQFKYKRDVMKKIYQNLTQVEFDVTDLLRGRCFFKRLSLINQAALSIISNINKLNNQNIKLIQIDNRLRTTTNDIVLKIKIGQIVSQFQLSLRFKQTQNQLYHKMYEINRSQMLSPVVQLYEIQRNCTNQYMSDLEQTIKQIDQPKSVKSDIMKKYEQLKKFINYEEESQDSDSDDDQNYISFNSPYNGLYKIQKISQRRILQLNKQKYLRTADYFAELGQYNQALHWYKQQLNSNQSDSNATIHKKIAKILSSQNPQQSTKINDSHKIRLD